MKVAFLHPDLGIGGAERLVVDAALALKENGHEITMFTSHHSPDHCFEETRDGTLNVTVYGDFFPRSIFGLFYIIFAIIRNIWAAFAIILFHKFDVIVVDQLSISIPLLRLTNMKILFYCHFPDKLLSKRTSTLKKIYRFPVDFLEEITTKSSHEIVVNSYFTQGVFKKEFPRISKVPQVLYPAINISIFDGEKSDENIEPYILSINRFERKKNIELLVKSVAKVKSKNVKVIIAGGYDERVKENVEYLEELKSLAEELKVLDKIEFKLNFDENEKKSLLLNCLFLVYTPTNEHFGIGPIEAMCAGKPVIAVNSGGPLETVVHDETGFLCDENPSVFAKYITKLYDDKSLLTKLGKNSSKRVLDFSSVAFSKSLNNIVNNLLKENKKKK